MKSIVKAIPMVLALCCLHCNLENDRSGKVIRNKARLEKAVPQSLPQMIHRVVGSDSPQPFRTTPSNLQGDLCYAILSLGELGPGMFGMTWLAPEETFPNGPEKGICSTVQFDLLNPATITSKVLIPETSADMPASEKIIRAELSFNYVDATFQVNDSSPEYTIRTVYSTTATAADVTGTMQQGDKLIKLPGETIFHWANATGTSANRSDVADGLFVDSTVVDYEHPGDGNPDYIPVTANFFEELPVTHELLTDTAKVWTLAFDLEDAIVWNIDPADITSPQQYVAAFRLKFGPNQSTTYGENDDGIRAQLKIE